MKRILQILLLSLAALLQAEARTPMREWLAAMPDSVMPLLVKNRRLDLIDFYDARMEAVVTNLLDGKSRLETLTEDFAKIGYTGASDVTMKLLAVNDTTDILCMVTTMKSKGKATVADSRIAFFDEQWNPLKATAYMNEPSIEDFRSTQQSDSVQWAWNKLDTFFRTYQLCAENTELKCVLTTTDYLSTDDRKELIPYLRKDPLTYRWTNGKYEAYE